MVKIREIDNQLYVSEYIQTPGKTDVKNYPVEFQRLKGGYLHQILPNIFNYQSKKMEKFRMCGDSIATSITCEKKLPWVEIRPCEDGMIVMMKQETNDIESNIETLKNFVQMLKDWGTLTKPNTIEEYAKQFKPFDKVLVRDHNTDLWRCSLYSHFCRNRRNEPCFITTCGTWFQCIPYKGNENLVGICTH